LARSLAERAAERVERRAEGNQIAARERVFHRCVELPYASFEGIASERSAGGRRWRDSYTERARDGRADARRIVADVYGGAQ
jgi:hypothetical protein